MPTCGNRHNEIRMNKLISGEGSENQKENQEDLLGQSACDFFFLRYGRSHSEARSLHETKLLVRKLRHGRRWSHEAWQIITAKTNNTQTSKNRARRRSPSQICVSPFERQQSKQPTGPEPNKKNHKRFAKDTVVKTHCVTLKDKKLAANELCHPEA